MNYKRVRRVTDVSSRSAGLCLKWCVLLTGCKTFCVPGHVCRRMREHARAALLAAKFTDRKIDEFILSAVPNGCASGNSPDHGFGSDADGPARDFASGGCAAKVSPNHRVHDRLWSAGRFGG